MLMMTKFIKVTIWNTAALALYTDLPKCIIIVATQQRVY